MKTMWAMCLLVAVLLSCDFIGTDMFPRELQFAAGDYDLAAELGIRPDEMGELRIERLVSYDGVHGVFALVKRTEGWRLFIFNDRMELVSTLVNEYFNRFLGALETPNSFICGTTSISDDYVVYGPNSYSGTKSNSLDIAGTSYIFNQQDIDDTTQIGAFLKDFYEPYGDPSPIVAGTPFDILDVSMLFRNSAQPRPALLARRRDGLSPNLLALGFPVSSELPTAFTGDPLVLNVNVGATWMSVDNTDGGWITDDGVVVLKHDDGSRLTRLDLATGAELDSIKIESQWMQGLSFEDSGEFWYYYDRRSGYIKQLRTWWR